MTLAALSDSGLYTWVILPVLIMIARICDVSIGTIKLLFVARGDKVVAPILGFFEITIWLLAIRQIMQNLSNPLCYLAYATGFALGNFMGILIEEKLAVGKRVLRVITKMDASDLIASFLDAGFGVTNVPAEGSQGKVNIVFMVVDRNDIDKAISLIKAFNPRAFYSIEDVRFASEGTFPEKRRWSQRLGAKLLTARSLLPSLYRLKQPRKGK